MDYAELAVLGAVITGLATFALLSVTATASWHDCWFVEKLIDSAIIVSMVALFSTLAYTVIILHDPARAAAFNPCDHPAPHKRPATCAK